MFKFELLDMKRIRTYIPSIILLIAIWIFMGNNNYLFYSVEENQILPIHLIVYIAISILIASILLVKVTISSKIKSICHVIALIISPLITYICIESIHGYSIFRFNFKLLFANVLCSFLVYLVVYLIMPDIALTLILSNTVLIIYATVNYFTTSFRGVPVLPWDILSFSTAFDVVGNYIIVFKNRIILSFLFSIFYYIIIYKLCFTGSLKKIFLNIKRRLVILAPAFMVIISIFYFDILRELGTQINTWDYSGEYKDYGVLASFTLNTQFLSVEKPANYSSQKVKLKAQSFIDEYVNESAITLDSGKLPNIILIMNESWADFESISSNIVLTEDNMSFIRNLGNSIQGTVYSSVFGSGTANSEYEALTGNSMAFLPVSSVPYQQYIKSKKTSLVSTLNSLGYTSIALHPGQSTAWQRDEAYPLLGFSNFIASDKLTIQQINLHNYLSDKADYEQVINEYENKEDGPLFIFNVTIQNHGGYTADNYETTIQLADEPGVYPMAEQYLSLIKDTDIAFEYLIDYFSNVDEPTIIMMFGDHQPSLEPEFFNKLLGKEDDELTIEDIFKKYQIPFVIWANYPIEEKIIEKTSLNYLSGILLDVANIKTTNYTQFLNQLQEDIPVITAKAYIDKNNVYHTYDEVNEYSELLNVYQMFQYNNAFDERGFMTDFFTINP